LPAWLWGPGENGSWGVRDSNSAADADLWLAYVLLEAERLWQAPAYGVRARQILAQVVRQEVVQGGASGLLLLPGPVGFALDGGRFRINPSYLPGFMFRYLAHNDATGPWQRIWDGYLDLAPQIYRRGVAPDNVVVDSAGTVSDDSESPPSGSYDAIRVYLWAGMSGSGSRELLHRLATYAELTRRAGMPPEKVDPRSGVARVSDYSPIGYSGALLPFLDALGQTADLERERTRVLREAERSGPQGQTNYYDQVLILFGQGWLDGHFRFDDDGRLRPRWASRAGPVGPTVD
jgi:endoglucanase